MNTETERLTKENLALAHELHDAMRDNHRLRLMLKDAWLKGSTHERPTFEMLNEWHAALNEK